MRLRRDVRPHGDQVMCPADVNDPPLHPPLYARGAFGCAPQLPPLRNGGVVSKANRGDRSLCGIAAKHPFPQGNITYAASITAHSATSLPEGTHHLRSKHHCAQRNITSRRETSLVKHTSLRAAQHHFPVGAIHESPAHASFTSGRIVIRPYRTRRESWHGCRGYRDPPKKLVILGIERPKRFRWSKASPAACAWQTFFSRAY